MLNHDGRRHLEACFTSLLAQRIDEGEFEAILLDNGSSDGSASYVRERFPAVRVIEAGGNLGFSAGNNLAIRQSRGDNVVVLNNDTRVRPGWLAALLRAVDQDRVGAVTSKLVFADRPGVIQNAGSILLSDGGGADRGFGEADRGQYDLPEEVFGFCGGAALLNRRALEDVGLFDPRLFAYYEDTDLSWRLRLRGWRILYEPGAVVDHVHAATNVEWSPRFTFQVDRNRLLVTLKNGSPRFVIGCFASVLRRSAGAAVGVGGQARRGTRWRVLASFLSHVPETLVKRFEVRRRRTVSDREIARFITPRAQWDARSG